jgi:hypothetical protein
MTSADVNDDRFIHNLVVVTDFELFFYDNMFVNFTHDESNDKSFRMNDRFSSVKR